MPTVLIIDDDHDTAVTLGESLAFEGFNVISIATSVRQDEIYLFNGPDLVILDIMLRGTRSGIDLAMHLRERDYRGPIVGVSASQAMLADARESGYFDTVVAKPFDWNDLTQVCRYLLEQGGGEKRA